MGQESGSLPKGSYHVALITQRHLPPSPSPKAGMGTAEWRAAKSPAYYTRGDYMPGMRVRRTCCQAQTQPCTAAAVYYVACLLCLRCHMEAGIRGRCWMCRLL